MKDLWKNIFYAFLIFLLFAGIFSLLNPVSQIKEISFSEFAKQVGDKEVKKVEVRGGEVLIDLKDGTQEVTQKEVSSSLEEVLLTYGIQSQDLQEIEITYREAQNDFLVLVLVSVVPVVFIIIFFWWMLRQGQKGATQAFTFSKARPRIYGAGGKEKDKVGFDDVADLKEAKEELKEIVEFLREPKKFLDMGARIPRGVLLVGPPGCGKTLLARAVASEAGVPFFSISGSEFVEMFVGVGAARVRDLFSLAKKNSPSILFLDELDAVGRHRGSGLGGGHDEREQTLNQILVEMDGFERETNVIIIAATNRPDILDPALLRPGRFDRHVVLDRPDIEGRKDILKIHSKGKPVAKDSNLREIAERTPGFSGADLANLMNESAILAARRNKKEITQDEFRESIEKVLLGPERKSHILSQKEKEITAYHEAGHAIVASFMPDSEPIQKISIIARGMAAGYTLKLPIEERHLKTKSQFLAELATFLGGYAAETMIFKEVTTGASNDLKQATDLARKLVMEYGMSRLGPIAFGEKAELVFLGKDLGEQRNYSEKRAAEIDNEVERFIKEAEKKAQKIIKEKQGLLKIISKVLKEKETIERQEFERIIKRYKEVQKTI
ncbi:MAG: ATP-dependent zinc metalloprotease FtsH [Patescibacteria group bacterium]